MNRRRNNRILTYFPTPTGIYQASTSRKATKMLAFTRFVAKYPDGVTAEKVCEGLAWGREEVIAYAHHTSKKGWITQVSKSNTIYDQFYGKK